MDMRLVENVWSDGVVLAKIKAMGYTGWGFMLRYYIQPKRKMRPSKKRFASKPSPVTSSSTTGKKLKLRLRSPDNDAGLTSRLTR